MNDPAPFAFDPDRLSPDDRAFFEAWLARAGDRHPFDVAVEAIYRKAVEGWAKGCSEQEIRDFFGGTVHDHVVGSRDFEGDPRELKRIIRLIVDQVVEATRPAQAVPTPDDLLILRLQAEILRAIQECQGQHPKLGLREIRQALTNTLLAFNE